MSEVHQMTPEAVAVRARWLQERRVRPEWLQDPPKRSLINALAQMEAERTAPRPSGTEHR